MDEAGQIASDDWSAGETGWLAFSVAEQQFALPFSVVASINRPPALVRVPHAPDVLVGAGNLDGRIVPILDARRLIGHHAGDHPYDGTGDILRLRSGESSVGLWVDSTNRIIHGAADDQSGNDTAVRLEGLVLLDPAALLGPSLATFAPQAHASNDETLELGSAAPPPVTDARTAVAETVVHISVEIAGQLFALRRDIVIELVDEIGWTPFPRAPAGLMGIGVLRGTAYPIVSWPALIGLADSVAPSAFALVEAAGAPALLALDRLIGLQGADAADTAVIDLDSNLAPTLRSLLHAFPRHRHAYGTSAGTLESGAAYLAFTMANQVFAAPIQAVERVTEWTVPVRLPRASNSSHQSSDVAGMIELRGQIIPVAAPLQQLGLADVDAQAEAGIYVILRGIQGLGAIPVQHVAGIVTLRADEIMPPPGGAGLIAGIGMRAAGTPVRIIAPELLWQAT